MKISKILAYRVDLPLHEGSYKWSGGKSVTVFDSTIVRVDTDDGVTGWGEVCPLGPFYLAAYGGGVRAGLLELGPHLIGEDPLQLERLNRRMDAALKGHPYVKSPIDMACWDILGKSPDDVMCASSRMVVKRKDAAAPAVLSCTLLPYDEAFELGASLAEAGGSVPLNHPHCAKFCVLGGASCSA